MIVVISSVPFLFLLRRFIAFQDLVHVIKLLDVLSFPPYHKYFCDGNPFLIHTPPMLIICIFDCLFFQNDESASKNAWKFKQWHDINKKCLCIVDKFNPVNTMFVLNIWGQNATTWKAIPWCKSRRADMDRVLHFRSGGFVPYFQSFSKRLDFFQLILLPLRTELNFFSYLVCGLLYSVM